MTLPLSASGVSTRMLLLAIAVNAIMLPPTLPGRHVDRDADTKQHRGGGNVPVTHSPKGTVMSPRPPMTAK
jgi:hypothetical protein